MQETHQVEQKEDYDIAQLLISHAKHVHYLLSNIQSSDTTDHDHLASREQPKYLIQIQELIDEAFLEDNTQAHDQLQQEIEKLPVFLQAHKKPYRYAQQLTEHLYDLSLLLAMKKPVNTLEGSQQGILYTSSQHRFKINALVNHINNNKGAFVNPETQLLFKKQDIQLIKMAAQQQKLKIVSQDTTEEAGRQLLKRIGFTSQPNIVIASRYEAESMRQFNPERIYQAVLKAFLDVSRYQDLELSESEYFTRVDHVTARTVELCIQKYDGAEHVLTVEQIQSFVESALMELRYYDVARSYVLYREEKNIVRQNRLKQLKIQKLFQPIEQTIAVKINQKTQKHLSKQDMAGFLDAIFQGYEHLNKDTVLDEWYRALYNGIPCQDFIEAAIMSCRAMIEVHPDYSFIAARILKQKLVQESLNHLLGYDQLPLSISEDYQSHFATFIQRGIKNKLINPDLQKFDMERLTAALKIERDEQFSYLGLQTLYDRYFLHESNIRYELPQFFFMRVAMGLALSEANKNERAIEFYLQLSSFTFMSATATLFNSGLVHSQLSSCFLTTIPDDLFGIYSSLRDNAMLSKFAGGLGNDWTRVRANKSMIKGTNGQSSGIVPFLNVSDASTIAVNQGGKRKGAACAYLETWHMDIFDFLELRKNTGDDRRRTHDMNTANWIPDLFMERVHQKSSWTLFSPDETPDLHECFGTEFKKRYLAYEQLAQEGKIASKVVDAVILWRKMLSMVFETGHPWFTFKDPCNIRSPQQHCGVVHSSNLCTEITLNTSDEEVAVCNLGSINLSVHVDSKGIDKAKLKKTITTAIRMLDNVIDLNYYPIQQAELSNQKHRPIGMGIMGFQDALYHLGISYESEQAVSFADELMELISYYAIEASSNLAKERGSYASFNGSLWSKGILPIDSIGMLAEQRGQQYLVQDTSQTLDWAQLREKVKQDGMRHSNVMAIAPTATIANICGVTQSIEPTYKNLFVKSNLSGEFTIINPYLVYALQKRGLWDLKMMKMLKISNGSVQQISGIPDEIKDQFKTVFELNTEYLIKAASRRAKWIDQSQSLNLYMAQASGKKLDKLYKDAWLHGLKTTYYLRSLGATDSEKSSIEDNRLNAVKVSNQPQACSIDNPDCEACQ
ncbi:MAG: ribonucleoside-diphosphate reductase subunit alpha [Pseudomonadota bacterium]|nr:ribonucleoside-diphosphate reductase subunit alpha [Pseudomonadota bacterium]